MFFTPSVSTGKVPLAKGSGKMDPFWVWFKAEANQKFERKYGRTCDFNNDENHHAIIDEWWTNLPAEEKAKWKEIASRQNTSDLVNFRRGRQNDEYRNVLIHKPEVHFRAKAEHHRRLDELNPARPIVPPNRITLFPSSRPPIEQREEEEEWDWEEDTRKEVERSMQRLRLQPNPAVREEREQQQPWRGGEWQSDRTPAELTVERMEGPDVPPAENVFQMRRVQKEKRPLLGARSNGRVGAIPAVLEDDKDVVAEMWKEREMPNGPAKFSLAFKPYLWRFCMLSGGNPLQQKDKDRIETEMKGMRA